jgi:uncharacterized protein
MRTLAQLPCPIREIEHVEIPMPDGCGLAARIWLPRDAEQRPVPAILEYIPYRKNDLTAARDAVAHPYFAGHGYASIRVDLRGTGESEGLMLDEYLQQELDDGYAVIEWIAAQSWCDGTVGMIGISWGGFNALQIAAMRPPALKAIITCCSTDDRYADDVHYMGGCLLIDNLSWASVMFWRNTLPPDPRHAPQSWRKLWLNRLQGSRLWLKTWLEHQHRDAYWKHGSVCEDYTGIACPVYAVGGWADGYCRAVFRLVENLKVPRKGLIGPWAHTYPHLARPEPAIGFLQECLRWWDHWLKGRDTGIMGEPALRLFMQDSAPPQSWYEERSGRWVAEPAWPSPHIEPWIFGLAPGGKLRARADAGLEPVAIKSPLWVGARGGKWYAYGLPGDQPVDQRADDAGSLTFETDGLAAPVEIAGEASLEVAFESDRPVAMLAVRLIDVRPDGTATRVSFGLLNLTHRNSHENPEPLEPGRRYQARIPLKHVAQHFAAGHRVRVSISTGYFPVAWPVPEEATVTIHAGRLALPVRPPRAEDALLPVFAPAEGAPKLEIEQISDSDVHRRLSEDLGNQRMAVEIGAGAGAYRIVANDLTVSTRGTERYSFEGDNMQTVTGEAAWHVEMSRGDWRIRTVTETRLTADHTHFHIAAKLTAWEGEDQIHQQEWNERVRRRLV